MESLADAATTGSLHIANEVAIKVIIAFHRVTVTFSVLESPPSSKLSSHGYVPRFNPQNKGLRHYDTRRYPPRGLCFLSVCECSNILEGFLIQRSRRSQVCLMVSLFLYIEDMTRIAIEVLVAVHRGDHGHRGCMTTSEFRTRGHGLAIATVKGGIYGAIMHAGQRTTLLPLRR